MLKLERKTGRKQKWQLGVRLAYIQVGGKAERAATPHARPRASRSGAEAKRTPQRANKPKTGQKARRRRGIAAEPLGDCRAHLSPRTAFFPSVLYRYCFPLQGTPRLCHFRQPRYHLSVARLSYVFSLYPAPEIVKEYELPPFQPVRADDILVHYVCFKILIQPSRIHQLAAGLLDIFHQVLHHLRQLRRVVNGTELVPPEPLRKESVLLYRLHSLLSGIIVPHFFQLSRHCSLRDIEYSVEMQSPRFGRSLPRAYIQPVLP